MCQSAGAENHWLYEAFPGGSCFLFRVVLIIVLPYKIVYGCVYLHTECQVPAQSEDDPTYGISMKHTAFFERISQQFFIVVTATSNNIHLITPDIGIGYTFLEAAKRYECFQFTWSELFSQ